jgi:hypothetical protein
MAQPEFSVAQSDILYLKANDGYEGLRALAYASKPQTRCRAMGWHDRVGEGPLVQERLRYCRPGTTGRRHRVG